MAHNYSKFLKWILLLFANVLIVQGFAQWPLFASDSLSLTFNTGVTTPAIAPTITDDGNGGAIVTWRDKRSGDLDVYAQRLDVNGIPQWIANGINVSGPQANSQGRNSIVSDGAGGAILVWQDDRSGVNQKDIYAQRISAAGSILWTAGGMLIGTSSASSHIQSIPLICTDGAGGAIICWMDERSSNKDVYAQKISASGVLQWKEGSNPMNWGIPVCTDPADQLLSEWSWSFNLAGDGFGGAFVVWEDKRSSRHVYGQRIRSNGTMTWTINGMQLESQTTTAYGPEGLSSSQEYAYFTYSTDPDFSCTTNTTGDPTGDEREYVSKIDTAGNFLWGPNGTKLTNNTTIEERFADVVSDGQGGAFVAYWWGGGSSGVAKASVQRINSGGAVATNWPPEGIKVGGGTTQDNTTNRPRIHHDGNQKITIVWADDRGTFCTPNRIYANCVDAAANVQSPPDGFEVRESSSVPSCNFFAEFPQITRSGTPIMTWGGGYLVQAGYVFNIFAARACDCSLTCLIPNVNIASTNGCNNSNNGTATVTAGSGAPPYSYLWNPGGATTQTITGLSPGTYMVTVKDVLDSTNSASVTIINPAPVVVSIYGGVTVCSGSSTVLNASASGGTPGYSYLWSNFITTDSIVVLEIYTNTSFTVNAADMNGCTGYNSASISVIPLPTVLCENVTVCYGNSAGLTASGASFYSWSPATGLNTTSGTNVTVSVPVSASYVITGMSSGCTDTTTVKVSVIALPAITISDDVIIEPGVSITLNATGGSSYEWSPSDGLSCITCQNPVADPRETTLYYLIVTDDYGCTSTDSVLVTIQKYTLLFVPNSFTPNEDNQNDIFLASGSLITNFEMKIFDRWGELLFTSNDMNKGWDGKYKNNLLQEDMYVWQINYQDKDKNYKKILGHVALIR